MIRKSAISDLTKQNLTAFKEHLYREEKSDFTIEKYMRDVLGFLCYVEKEHKAKKQEEEDWELSEVLNKEMTISYKAHLEEQGYAVRSINSMLASLNKWLDFLGRGDCKVKNLKCQRQTYCAEEKELSKEEYLRLLEAAKGQEQLYLILQTICSTGIRVSELRFFTVENVRKGEISVCCKSKIRTILIPGKLRKILLKFTAGRQIKTGTIFRNGKGNPIDRSVIWAQMKRLCMKAKVNPAKVFPHNLRKLFARSFYHLDKDIAKLADILGHGSIETTRIYIMSTGTEHRRQIERLGLVI